MHINEVLTRFDGVKKTSDKQWIAKCPCHDDRKASLSIGIGNNGGILIHCQASCDTRDVLARVGLSIIDLKPQIESHSTSEICATYDYGNGLQKVRYYNKSFKWRRSDGKGGWIYNRGDVEHCMYVRGEESDTIYIVEGEKDVDNLSRLGYYVASAENGAGGSGRKWFESYNDSVAEKHIRIIPDNDDVGMEFARYIVNQVKDYAESIKILELPKVWNDIRYKQDISDMIYILGAAETKSRLHTLEQITDEIIDNADIINELEKNAKGEVLCSTDNFLQIFRKDRKFKGIRYNLLKQYPEIISKHTKKQWTDDEDAWARLYIEQRYGIRNKDKLDDAFRVFSRERAYNPITEILDSFKWDGIPRCEEFLIKWMGADDTPYSRECSRLIFSGAVNRGYRIGCKFDDIVVMIGLQGCGKTTMCQWLALDKDLYVSAKTIYGQRGYESIQGKWIVELEELLAVIANDKGGTKTEENAKAFLSASSDYYRHPYDRRPKDNPRGCIFIGTTNRETFLTDKTGNRRWYPITTKGNSRYLNDHKDECQEYIRQCYAEMVDALKSSKELALPMARKELHTEIRAEQSDAEQDYWRVGVIGEFLKSQKFKDNGYQTCCIEIWRDVLHDGERCNDIGRADSNAISEILRHSFGMERLKSFRHPIYGVQKGFYLPIDESSTPFAR